jgi:hypothetical protein
MTLEEMIEARANHMFAGKNRTQDELDAARDVIVLEYAEKNPAAMKGLMEGNACVMPLSTMKSLAGRDVQYIKADAVRLDQGSG